MASWLCGERPCGTGLMAGLIGAGPYVGCNFAATAATTFSTKASKSNAGGGAAGSGSSSRNGDGSGVSIGIDGPGRSGGRE